MSEPASVFEPPPSRSVTPLRKRTADTASACAFGNAPQEPARAAFAAYWRSPQRRLRGIVASARRPTHALPQRPRPQRTGCRGLPLGGSAVGVRHPRRATRHRADGKPLWRAQVHDLQDAGQRIADRRRPHGRRTHTRSPWRRCCRPPRGGCPGRRTPSRRPCRCAPPRSWWPRPRTVAGDSATWTCGAASFALPLAATGAMCQTVVRGLGLAAAAPQSFGGEP